MWEKLRIYVGGLGLNVKEDDLIKTFTSPHLGTVDSVEILRTKGRSFAYLEFVPASDKGLAKLFSTYNGCMWKGGKLRLEKAKEHYLLRLKREWAEDVELAEQLPSQNSDTAENKYSLEKSKKDPNVEKMHLRIFFPKLRKIKALPFKGTGKHKYSFQRVEVPPLPVHFCDCEEHSGPHAVTENADNNETENFGVKEEELNMMKSVLNKLFERENCSNAASTEAVPGFNMEVGNSAALLNNVQVEDGQEDQVSDEDNLIMNMVAGPSYRIDLSKNWRQEATTSNRDSTLKQRMTISDRRSREMHGSQKRKILPSKNKTIPLNEDERKNVPSRKRIKECPDILVNCSQINPNTQPEETASSSIQLINNAAWLQKSKNLVSQKANTAVHSVNRTNLGPEVEEQQRSDGLTPIEHTNKEKQSSQVKELENFTNVRPGETKATADKSARGAAWLQKSSWTQLVGDAHNNSFSISQIVPGVTFEKQELPQFSGFGLSRNNKQHKSIEVVNKTGEGANKDFTTPDKSEMDALTEKEQNHSGLNAEQSNPGRKQKIGKDIEASTPPPEKKVPSALNRASLGDIVTSETCPFMRNAASIKEWTKTKAALSGSFKKKGKEK